MNKYLIVIEGIGEGCDYTIGCNINYCKIEAESFEDAKNKYIQERFYNGDRDDDRNWDSENDIDKITVYQYSESQEFDIDAWYQSKAKEQKNKQGNDEQYQQYLKLKRKYEEDIDDEEEKPDSTTRQAGHIPTFAFCSTAANIWGVHTLLQDT